MDDQRFDRLTRWFAGRRSRRQVLASGVSVIGAAVLASVDGTDAALARSRKCTDQADGTPCGRCGVCQANVCVPDSDSCGFCGRCDAATLICKPANDGSTCSSCGVCNKGRCRPDQSRCTANCEKCRRSADGVPICVSRCPTGQNCCPDGRCISPETCCPGEQRCPSGQCCQEDQTCADVECCGGDPADIVCAGNGFTVCCHGGQCCFTENGTPFCCPSTQTCCELACCGDGLECCDGECKPPEECCTECGPCQRCNRDNPNIACEPDPVKEGTSCGAGGCGSLCKDGTCTPIKANEPCLDGKTCCGLICCDGQCLPDGTCCGQGGQGKSFAAQANLCCPFGPPCGLSGNVECCLQGETCANDVVFQVPICCPTAQMCGPEGSKTCCGEGQQCCGANCCDSAELCCAAQGTGTCYPQQGLDTCCGSGFACAGAEICCLSVDVPGAGTCVVGTCPPGFFPQ